MNTERKMLKLESLNKQEEVESLKLENLNREEEAKALFGCVVLTHIFTF